MNESNISNSNNDTPNTDSKETELTDIVADAAANETDEPESIQDKEERLRWAAIDSLAEANEKVCEYLDFIESDPNDQDLYLNVDWEEELEPLGCLASDAQVWSYKLDGVNPWDDGKDETVGEGGVVGSAVGTNEQR